MMRAPPHHPDVLSLFLPQTGCDVLTASLTNSTPPRWQLRETAYEDIDLNSSIEGRTGHAQGSRMNWLITRLDSVCSGV